jgi:hypothetical protein
MGRSTTDRCYCIHWTRLFRRTVLVTSVVNIAFELLMVKHCINGLLHTVGATLHVFQHSAILQLLQSYLQLIHQPSTLLLTQSCHLDFTTFLK